MSKLRTFTRRTFLVGSAVIAGGVAFGTYWVRKPHRNPLLAELNGEAATFNPWVKVDQEKVTLIVPHADSGQGVASMQAALIAEELDIEFGQFEISFGQPSPAYWNHAMGEEAVPFMSTDRSLQAETMREVMTAVGKVVGLQGTGGSSSVPDSFVKLRAAGATARETLKQAAAKRSGLPKSELTTAAGAVLLPDGTKIPYTELALLAAGIEPATDVPLRDPSTWRLLGNPMQRLDITAKSTGALKYGIDLVVDGMVHAAVKLSPRRSELLSSETSRAEAMPGVRQVVPVTNGLAVIADNTWAAFKAAKAIECRWADAPYPAEQAAHWQAVEGAFTADRLNKEWRNDGDVVDGLERGQVSQAEYRAPYVAHQPLEPLGAIVAVYEDRVEVWSGHQLPRFVQQKVAAVTGHDAEQVIFHNQYIGGSFGHRLEFEHVTLAAEIAKQMRGTPVKLTFSREEDFAQDFPRQIGMARGRGAVANGRVQTVDLSIATVSSVASQSGRLGLSAAGPDPQIPAGAWNLPYRIPNFRLRSYVVPALAPVSSWRSVGASTAGFFADCFVDELIHAAGGDPMAERIRLCADPVAKRVLEAVAEMSNWARPLGANRGRGVAFVESFGVPTAEVVEVSNTSRGIRIDRVFVAADVGTIVDPIAFDNQVKGGVVWGLGHAINCEITYADGMAQQTNYHAHEAMRLYQCPEIEVRGLENAKLVRGIGEPTVPPAAPALANAIFAATGQRIREMPFNKHIEFV